MEKMSNAEKSTREYYDSIWYDANKTPVSLEELFFGYHFAYYEKGVKNWREAMLNTNDLMANLLDLNVKKSMKVLDVGCGAGGTSIYLAMKYPNVTFTGITLSANEIKLAKKLKQHCNISNAEFLVGNFIDTAFPNDFFDGVFALDSSCYAEDKTDFVKEMSRVIKSNGRFVVLDGFLTGSPLGVLSKTVYSHFLDELALSDLATIGDFSSLLKNVFFRDIKIVNITKNPFVSIIRSFQSFIISGSKGSYSFEEDKRHGKESFFIDELFYKFILELGKKMSCYVISATKE